MIAKTPEPPYYAVIFTSVLAQANTEYARVAQEMMELAQQPPGFLGFESAREDVGISVSYWETLESISAWKQDAAHLEAQRLGREQWYRNYRIRIARVEREYGP